MLRNYCTSAPCTPCTHVSPPAMSIAYSKRATRSYPSAAIRAGPPATSAALRPTLHSPPLTRDPLPQALLNLLRMPVLARDILAGIHAPLRQFDPSRSRERRLAAGRGNSRHDVSMGMLGIWVRRRVSCRCRLVAWGCVVLLRAIPGYV
ncbi:hypothetical protein BD779DRAFT_159753 [Infundibulicybe gibba]|nr:hypothetical protein BD779DRAFT_159753 [Infundibulicybe gibba]